MTKVKIVGALVFFISLLLLVLFNKIETQNSKNNNLFKTINQQKSFTQELSKNIFYIAKNKDASTQQMNNTIKQFLQNMDIEKQVLPNIACPEIKVQNAKIIQLWNEFYTLVQDFKDHKKVRTTYSSILLEKIVLNIYNKNLELVLEFNNLLEISKKHLDNKISLYKNVQYLLFFILVALLLYLFTQLRSILNFIQKFLSTSQNIITNATIKELKPIDVVNSSQDISQASSNFNQLVENINESVKYSSEYLEHSTKSLEVVEMKIENLMELIYQMEENKPIDNNLTKKEDALIQSLEELTVSAHKLKNLQRDLEALVSHYNK